MGGFKNENRHNLQPYNTYLTTTCKTIFAYTPAATSSITIPIPPPSRSSCLAGGGFVMSNSLKRKNPSTTDVTDTGANAIVTKYPDTSSATINPGSVLPADFSITPEAHTETAITASVRST